MVIQPFGRAGLLIILLSSLMGWSAVVHAASFNTSDNTTASVNTIVSPNPAVNPSPVVNPSSTESNSPAGVGSGRPNGNTGAVTTPAIQTGGMLVPRFEYEVEERRYQALIAELRCPKCQNQNLAGSDAPIAQDLKRSVYDQITDGRSDQEIRGYLIERYGDFITYKPPMKGAALWLWLLPPILLLVLILGWLRYVNQRKRERYAQRLTDHEQVRLQQILGQHRKDSAP